MSTEYEAQISYHWRWQWCFELRHEKKKSIKNKKIFRRAFANCENQLPHMHSPLSKCTKSPIFLRLHFEMDMSSTETSMRPPKVICIWKNWRCTCTTKCWRRKNLDIHATKWFQTSHIQAINISKWCCFQLDQATTETSQWIPAVWLQTGKNSYQTAWMCPLIHRTPILRLTYTQLKIYQSRNSFQTIDISK